MYIGKDAEREEEDKSTGKPNLSKHIDFIPFSIEYDIEVEYILSNTMFCAQGNRWCVVG